MNRFLDFVAKSLEYCICFRKFVFYQFTIGVVEGLEALLTGCESEGWTHDELRTAMLRMANRIKVSPGDLYHSISFVSICFCLCSGEPP